MRRTPSRARIMGAVADQRPRALRVACPRCEAAPGDRCFVSRSWVSTAPGPTPSTGPGGDGFYTERTDRPHPERREAARAAADTGGRATGREELRREIRSIIVLKLGGRDRVDTRLWASSTRRTDEELAERLAQLRAMPDLPK